MNRIMTSQPVLEIQLFFWKSVVVLIEKALSKRYLFKKVSELFPLLAWGLSAYAAGWLIGELLRSILY